MPHTMFGDGNESAMCGGIEILEDYSFKKKKVVSSPKEEIVDSKLNKVKSKAKKRKGGAENQVPTKKRKNVFEVQDVSENFHESEQKSKNKKNKKKSKNKPAINLDALSNIGKPKEEINPVIKPSLPSTKNSKKVSKSKVLNTPTITEDKPKKQDRGKLHDMNAWREMFVCEEIISALEEKGFTAPTPIQKLTLPAALKGRMDIVGAAETGSGKTLALGIPIVQGILNDRKKDEERKLNKDISEPEPEDFDDEPPEEELLLDEQIETVETMEDEEVEKDLVAGKLKGDKLRALILTPTRELAIQIKNHIQHILVKTDLSCTVIVGGISPEKQLRLLKRRPEIVVATPGRLWELVQDGVPHLADLANIRYLAIDETDRMSEKGHFEELQKLLEMMSAEGKGVRQNFIMSATLSLVHKPPAYNGKKTKQMSPKDKMNELMTFVGVSERRKVVDITRKVGTAETLSETVIHCSLEEKDAYLYYFIKTHKGRTIVFCNSIDCVRRLGNLFSYLDTHPLPIHSQLHQKQRLKNLERFTGSDSGLLIATDVAARGLDIPNIEHVVHYQVPRTSEGYVHRSGRTARANKAGISVLLIDPSELYLYKKLCFTLSRKLDLPTFPVDGGRFAGVMARMQSARRLDQLLLQARKKSVDENWMQKAAQEADIILSDNDDSEDDQGMVSALNKQTTEGAKRELQFLLSTPLIASEFSGRYPTMTGSLPHKLYRPSDLGAVDALNQNLSSTTSILGKKNKPEIGRAHV